MFGFFKNEEPLVMLPSYGSFTAYAKRKEIDVVPCENGSKHFSIIEP